MNKYNLVAICCIILLGESSKAQEFLRPTASSLTEFEAGPTNSTMPVGGKAILKCKLRKPVHSCQWFYLAPGLDFFDETNSPILVKEFPPSRSRDCSIKFDQAKSTQRGQWVCKGMTVSSKKYIISDPAFINVVEQSPDDDAVMIEGRNLNPTPPSNEHDPTDPPTNNHYPFIVTEDMRIINAHIGEPVLLKCITSISIKSCDWVRPDGSKLLIIGAYKDSYEIQGNNSDGECFLMVKSVSASDEGNWRCTITVERVKGEILSPLTHLHVLELGINAHPHDPNEDKILNKRSTSLIVILVTTSLILLVFVIALVVFLVHKKAWRRHPTHKYFETNRDGNSEYSGYGQWMHDLGGTKDPGLLSDQSSVHCGYLDMSGRASSRAPRGCSYQDTLMQPAVSIRTLGPAPSIPLSGVDSRKNKSEQNVCSASNFGNPTFGVPSEEVAPLDDSNSHLYEDIDQFAKSRLNPDEDTEGYMVPNRRERLPTPPHSNNNSYSNLTTEEVSPQRDSGFDPSDTMEDPNAPPVPVRIDSAAENPLANYDVPKKSTESLDAI